MLSDYSGDKIYILELPHLISTYISSLSLIDFFAAEYLKNISPHRTSTDPFEFFTRRFVEMLPIKFICNEHLNVDRLIEICLH